MPCEQKPWWERALPPSDHPLWKIGHAATGVVLLLVMGAHQVEGAHLSPDLVDAAGPIGLGFVGRALYLYVKS